MILISRKTNDLKKKTPMCSTHLNNDTIYLCIYMKALRLPQEVVVLCEQCY